MTTPALSNSMFDTAGSAVSDLFGGFAAIKAAKGLKAGAALYDEASQFSALNAVLAGQQTKVSQVQADRQIYQTVGGQEADVAGAGFTAGGSALDILRSSAQQGALTRQVIGQQGLIKKEGFEQEAKSYALQAANARAEAKASKKKGWLKIAKSVGTAALMFA